MVRDMSGTETRMPYTFEIVRPTYSTSVRVSTTDPEAFEQWICALEAAIFHVSQRQKSSLSQKQVNTADSYHVMPQRDSIVPYDAIHPDRSHDQMLDHVSEQVAKDVRHCIVVSRHKNNNNDDGDNDDNDNDGDGDENDNDDDEELDNNKCHHDEIEGNDDVCPSLDVPQVETACAVHPRASLSPTVNKVCPSRHGTSSRSRSKKDLFYFALARDFSRDCVFIVC
jgi:hypothetical protein